MRIAIPVAQGKLCLHFGHCEQFALIDPTPEARSVGPVRLVDAPAHQPGLLPAWLGEQGVTQVIAGGMGQRAQALFEARGIGVVTGAPGDAPEKVAQAYLEGTLVTGGNACDH